jgi:hypothetical protein
MALSFLNGCIFRATSGGTGPWVVASAVTGYDVPADCTNPVVVDGATYRADIRSDDNTQWMITSGTWDVGTDTYTVVDILSSSNGGSAVTFSAAPSVAMGGALAQDQAPEPVSINVTPSGSDPDFIFLLLPQYAQPLGGAKTLLGTRCAQEIVYKNSTVTFDTDVQVVTGNFGGDNPASMTDLTASDLVYAGSLGFGHTGSVTNLDLSALKYVAQTADFENIGVTNFELPLAEYIGGSINVYNSSAVEDVDLPLLKIVGSQGLNIRDNSLLESINIASLLSVGGDGSFENNALLQATVDHILVVLAGLDGTGGTTSYDNHFINLTGGTNASPSGTGLAAKTTLEGRGNTVIVN